MKENPQERKISFVAIAAAGSALVAFMTSGITQPQGAVAAEDEQLEMLLALCEEILCYPAGDVHLNLEDGSTETTEFDYPLPIVQGGGFVSIFPGKTIFIEADISEGRLVDLRAVEEPGEEGRYLELSMWQESGESDTFLRVTNFFSEIVKFRAGMMLPDGDDLFATSSCPVLDDGRVSFEHWPFPIFQLVFADFHFVSGDADSLVCE